MAVKSVCVAPHETLGTVAAPITSFSDELRALVDDLIDTMHAYHGVGLAAPQLGYPVQVFVANPSQQLGDELVVVNPILEQVSGRTAIVEGCLSLPHVWEHVPRWAWVRLKGQDRAGKSVCLEVEGLLAIVIQHEVDHLHGLLLTDRSSVAQQHCLLGSSTRQ